MLVAFADSCRWDFDLETTVRFAIVPGIIVPMTIVTRSLR